MIATVNVVVGLSQSIVHTPFAKLKVAYTI
jgi:hypothetical protein